MKYKFLSDKQRLNTFIVHTVGGEKLRIVANRYIINRDASTIDFFTDDEERRDGHHALCSWRCAHPTCR